MDDFRFRAAFARLDAFVEGWLRVRNVPGLALALTDRERTLRVATYGYADLAARKPVRPDTLFEIGSIGKSFTAIALLQLAAAGRVDLHAPVARYLPSFAPRSSYAPITLHHLLSHTAGIVAGTDFAPASRYEVWALRETDTGRPPGEHFHYSNVGYKALGFLLEEVTGRSYGDLLRTAILEPLGMAGTEPTLRYESHTRSATGYRRLHDDRPARRDGPLVPVPPFEYGAGDGSPASTAGDMARWVRLLLNRGRGPRGRVLSEESFDLLTAPAVAMRSGMSYGYGLILNESDGAPQIGHGGEMIGFRTTMLADVGNGLGAIVLINGPGEPYGIAEYALKVLRATLHGHDLPPARLPGDLPSIARTADYVGSYGSGDRRLLLEAEGERLILLRGGERVPLERRGADSFYVDHPDLARFLLRFGRDEGRVSEAFHGPDWFPGGSYDGPRCFDLPDGWAAYPGHYRSHNPWLPSLRVVTRKGALVLIRPSGLEEPLTPLGDGLFRPGADRRSPERLRFDAIVDGRALRVNYSGCDLYRVLTP